MLCSTCKTDNPADAAFCEQCGSKLELFCPGCGAAVSPAARFCKKCGTALGESAGVAAKKSNDATIRVADTATPETIEGERKTVTALFADIKGSTELMEDLDSEEARAIVDPALRLMIDAVQRYDGYVVQSTGDGIFALFGAPVAHEDHPQRALYAALRMQEEMRSYSSKLREVGDLPIEARFGVNTGEVVVRTISTGGAKTEYTPIGHTTNLASRMQALAPTGSIAVSENTCHLIEGYFVLKALGPTRVKGLSEPVNVYEVSGLGPLRTRLQRAVGRGLTKFVGRQHEMETLKRALEQTRSGHGQIVAAMAEPGVGKSRLYYEFKAVSQAGCMVLETFSVSHGKASAYLPVIDLLHGYFRLTGADDERIRREKVAGRITILDRALEDTLRYLFALLGIAETPDPLAQMDGQIKKRRTLEAIKRILLRESLNQPLMVIFEDLHWIDEATQELLNLLADSIGTAKILLLVNYRPEYSHLWNSKTYYSQLRLDPLGKESAEGMLAVLLGDGAELAPLKRLIIEKTEGNPFYMEETVQVLLDEGALMRNGSATKLTKPLAELKIPPTVQAILASRIDRLPHDAKELLQTLAVIGREYPLSLIRAVVTKSDDELSRLIEDLQLGEFIYEQPAVGDTEYIFKHALTQEVAANSLLMERRRQLHEQIGQALEILYASSLDDRLAELAHHYSLSGNVQKAAEYLGRAGSRAERQSAHSEATGYFIRALELLRSLPNDLDRAGQELDLQMALSWSAYVSGGPQMPLREPALIRAKELSEQLGDNRLMEVLMSLAHLRFNRREFEQSREVAERLLALAVQTEVPAMVSGGHALVGLVLFSTGQFEASREHLERAIELFAAAALGEAFYPHALPGLLRVYVTTIAPGVLGALLIILGYSSLALSRSRQLLADARARLDPFSTASAFLSTAMQHFLLRDRDAALSSAEAVLSMMTEHEVPLYLNQMTFIRDWAMQGDGSSEERVARMHRALSDTRFREAQITALMLPALAEALGEYGHPEQGLDVVTEGLAATESGQKGIEAEVRRVKGELLLILVPPRQIEAEGCLRTAVDIAHRQAARLYELRATTSLARLLRDTGRRDEARAMLAGIYYWFTEGFDTADLKDARALLDELST